MSPELIQDIILWAGVIFGAYIFMVLTWVMYLAIMGLIPYRKQMHPVAKAHAYVLVAIGLIMDTILNVVIASVLLLQPPGEFLLTTRLKKNIKRGGWRGAVSSWVCVHLLDQFDPKGYHCYKTNRFSE
jgi:hypothetical protein